MKRSLVALLLKVALVLLVFIRSGTARAAETTYVFLITADGLRHQELFGGVDPALVAEANKELSGVEDLDSLRAAYWSEDRHDRRRKLMPFFWKELAPQGIVLGNRALGSRVSTKNPHRFSYPGYAEILNGQPQEAVDSNSPVWSPRKTILEYLREQFVLENTGVATFASWRIFNWITMHSENAIFCNAGYEAMPQELATPEMALLDRLQFDMVTPWDTVRHDSVTLGLGLEYVRQYKPKFFYLSLGETDDWAHDRRYDRTVHAIRQFDDALRQVWTLVQSLEPYKGRTSLVITTDHGRGRKGDDWTTHGAETPGSSEIWIAVVGPDTPARGVLRDTPDYYQSNIAATILALLDLDYKDFNPEADPPISEAIGK
ncbi:MAG: sulfatase-like hydrolase/transferase [Acidobacteriota bacterium]